MTWNEVLATLGTPDSTFAGDTQGAPELDYMMLDMEVLFDHSATPRVAAIDLVRSLIGDRRIQGVNGCKNFAKVSTGFHTVDGLGFASSPFEVRRALSSYGLGSAAPLPSGLGLSSAPVNAGMGLRVAVTQDNCIWSMSVFQPG
jgi:hypothetical protein